jgi:hypothetical protein
MSFRVETWERGAVGFAFELGSLASRRAGEPGVIDCADV